jgi:hypothetical protein
MGMKPAGQDDFNRILEKAKRRKTEILAVAL